tara:strand:+ start:2692 stop:2988 length:297 start_codon:yes stop_codon:yes gene_type:complete
MNEDIIIGSITIPYSLSNTERLLWLEDWVYASSEGLLCKRIVELIFIKEEDIADSMKYLMESKRWIYIGGNEFFTPNGTVARFLHDEEAERLLNEIRR